MRERKRNGRKRERATKKDREREMDKERKTGIEKERNRKGKTTKGEEPSELENMSQKMTKCFLILLIKA